MFKGDEDLVKPRGTSFTIVNACRLPPVQMYVILDSYDCNMALLGEKGFSLKVISGANPEAQTAWVTTADLTF